MKPDFLLRLFGISTLLLSVFQPLTTVLAAGGDEPGGGAKVFRTMMPDSGPSAFAVGLSEGVSYCFDPVRGGLNYAWVGGFVDLEPTWKGKINEQAEILGKIFYREKEVLPLRPGSPDRVPEIRFLGYRLGDAAPTFRYRLDETTVEETIYAHGSGLRRHFLTDSPGGTFFFRLEEQSASRVRSENAVRRSGWLRIEADSKGEFTLDVLRVSPRHSK